MHIGTITTKDRPVALAPMEDVTDMPFRLICKDMGADLVYTEFTSSDALIRNIPRALKKITVAEAERPIAIQIFGRAEESMESATKMAEQFNPDFIDINCGCWVKNHVGKGSGAALLKDLPRFEKIVKAVVHSTPLPVTVKTRLGWDQENIIILDVAKMVEQAGAKALTVHCRTRSQAHNGQADWRWLEKIKKVTSIPLLGNGDVTCPETAKQMFETGCDGVMIGRAAIGNPWIFQRTRHYLDTGVLLPEPTLRERVEGCARHLRLAVQIKGVRGGVLPFRKYYAGYFKGIPNIARMRNEIMQMLDPERIIQRMYDFLEENQKVIANA